METQDERVQRVIREEIDIVPYDPSWPSRFEEEREHLLDCLPQALIRRMEHFGSTAVPGLAAKPIIDMLIEVTNLEQTRLRITPILESQQYEFFWRPARDDDRPPFYAWFIKRDAQGARTHHLHFVEAQCEHWDRLLFRDYLIAHPDVATEYEQLKFRLLERHRNDRVAYTKSKTEFVLRVTEQAREFFRTG